jgi:hypothetical protein
MLVQELTVDRCFQDMRVNKILCQKGVEQVDRCLSEANPSFCKYHGTRCDLVRDPIVFVVKFGFEGQGGGQLVCVRRWDHFVFAPVCKGRIEAAA